MKGGNVSRKIHITRFLIIQNCVYSRERNRRPVIKDIHFYHDPTYRPPPKPVRIPTLESPENIDVSPELNIDFEENSPFQEGIILEPYLKAR